MPSKQLATGSSPVGCVSLSQKIKTKGLKQEMTIISKVHVDDIPTLRNSGVKIEFLPLSVIATLYGEEELATIGDHHYVYINADSTLQAFIAMSQLTPAQLS